ncbi:MAG TPA: hypothetical protein ENK43_01320 [Planctomycetes bacterium]|nr:hypothetical protein [Planctomycetota bacterium]
MFIHTKLEMTLGYSLLFLSILLSTGAAQKIAPRPTWVDEEPSLLLPPEYTGSYPETVKIQFMTGLSSARSSLGISLHGSTTSGTLWVLDVRPSATQKSYGWDTGFARIHSICKIPQTSSHPHRFMAIAFNEIDKKCRILLLEFPVSGNPVQQVVGPTSASNALWTTGRLLRGSFYLYDAQSHVIRRVIDSDADGSLDALDPAFVIPVPQDSQINPMASDINPVLDFGVLPDGRVSVNRTNGRTMFVIEDVAGVFRLSQLSVPQKPMIRIDNGLQVNQKRICVYGSPGVEFRVFRQNPGAADVPISSTWTIPSAQWIAVDLKSALESSWKIRAVPTGGDAEPTNWLDVDSTTQVVLFQRPLTVNGNQGDSFVFEGFGFRPSHKICWSNSLGSGELPTSFKSEYSVVATLPILGNVSSEPSHGHYAFTLFWVKDSTTGQVVSRRMSLMVRYD